jgi:hypothetical protein
VACAVGAVAAAGGAVVAFRRSPRAADAAVVEPGGAVARARAAAAAALASRARALEAEAARAAAVPQLRAALADGVDAATLLDLFETEDWWAPFRARASALVSGSRLVAVRGDKELPLPDAATIAQAREAGVASGVRAGVRPMLEAVAPTALPRHGEATYVVLAAPLDAAALEVAAGAPVLVSDGHAALATSGAEVTLARLRTAVGHEGEGMVADADGAGRAAVAPLGPGLWVWLWLPGAPSPAGGAPVPYALLGAALLFGVAGLTLWRTGARRASAPMTMPGMAAAEGRPPRRRRGTLPYETDEAGHAPGAPADGAVVPAPAGEDSSAARRAAGVSSFIPERTRVSSDINSFGRYRLIDRLGEGGMAELYTAASYGAEGFRRVFALKRLRPEMARNRVAVEQFIDEAKLGSSLVHSNIVPVFDFGKVGDEYFMAQEYIIGRDMIRLTERHVEREGRGLDERLVLYVAHEVLDALSYAHNQTDATGKPLGLVHRDISPGNIMVTSRGEVKLADFGIVKAAGRLSTTDVGVVKGNVSFMSPEQARGQAVDARSDLFSLGLVMYYGLTNDPLYPGTATFERLMKAATGPRTEHLQRMQELPPAVWKVLVRALAVDPDARFQTAAEFAAELAPLVVGVKAEAAAVMQRLFGDELRKEAAI